MEPIEWGLGIAIRQCLYNFRMSCRTLNCDGCKTGCLKLWAWFVMWQRSRGLRFLLFSVPVLAIFWAFMAWYDIEEWNDEVYCTLKQLCNGPIQGNQVSQGTYALTKVACDLAQERVKILFQLYTVCVPTQISKTIILIAIRYSHFHHGYDKKHRDATALVESGIGAIVLHTIISLFDLVLLVASIYRYTMTLGDDAQLPSAPFGSLFLNLFLLLAFVMSAVSFVVLANSIQLHSRSRNLEL